MKITTFVMGVVGTNCYIVHDDKKNAVIVDCTGEAELYIKFIEENSLNVTHVLLTHGHFDHISCVDEMKKRYKCKVVLAEIEKEFLKNVTLNCSSFGGVDVIISDADIYVTEGDEIITGDLDFKVIMTPGHTVGSVCYIIDNVIFSGDTLFQGSCGRTDLPTGNWETISKSLHRLRDLDGDYTVYSGHGMITTLDAERHSNPYMQ